MCSIIRFGVLEPQSLAFKPKVLISSEFSPRVERPHRAFPDAQWWAVRSKVAGRLWGCHRRGNAHRWEFGETSGKGLERRPGGSAGGGEMRGQLVPDPVSKLLLTRVSRSSPTPPIPSSTYRCRRQRRSRASWSTQSKTSHAEPPVQRRQRL